MPLSGRRSAAGRRRIFARQARSSPQGWRWCAIPTPQGNVEGLAIAGRRGVQRADVGGAAHAPRLDRGVGRRRACGSVDRAVELSAPTPGVPLRKSCRRASARLHLASGAARPRFRGRASPPGGPEERREILAVAPSEMAATRCAAPGVTVRSVTSTRHWPIRPATPARTPPAASRSKWPSSDSGWSARSPSALICRAPHRLHQAMRSPPAQVAATRARPG